MTNEDSKLLLLHQYEHNQDRDPECHFCQREVRIIEEYMGHTPDQLLHPRSEN